MRDKDDLNSEKGVLRATWEPLQYLKEEDFVQCGARA